MAIIYSYPTGTPQPEDKILGIQTSNNNQTVAFTLSSLLLSGQAGSFSTLAVTGNSTLQGTLSVAGNTTLSGNATIAGTASITGDTDITGSLDVAGALNMTGNITGNVIGNVTGNVTGNLTGNVTGNVTGDVTGDVTGNADTATKIASITNSNIVQLGSTQTLTNKTLASPTVTGTLTGNTNGVHSGSLQADVTATTQAFGSNNTKVATTAFVEASNASAGPILLDSNNSLVVKNSSIVTSGTASSRTFVVGNGNTLSNGSNYSVMGGLENTLDGALSAVAFGWKNKVTGDYASVLSGREAIASGFGSTVIGGMASRAFGEHSIAGGQRSIAGAGYSVALGYGAATIVNPNDSSSNNGSFSCGINTLASGEGAAAFGGAYTISRDTYTVTAGGTGFLQEADTFKTVTSLTGNITVQVKLVIISGVVNSVVALDFPTGLVTGLQFQIAPAGGGTSALLTVGTVNKYGSLASFSLTSGTSNYVGGSNSFAGGSSNKVEGTSSIAYGADNQIASTVDYTAVFGSANILSAGDYGFVAGKSNAVSNTFPLVAGNANTVQTQYAFVHGSSNQSLGSNANTRNFIFGASNTMSISDTSASIGHTNTVASSDYALAAGQANSISNADESFAIGGSNTIVGNRGGALGYNNETASAYQMCIGSELTLGGVDRTIAVGSYNATAQATLNTRFEVGTGSSTDRYTSMSVNVPHGGASQGTRHNASGLVLAALKDSASYADDSAAATNGVLVGELYHTAGVVKIRLT